MNFHERLQEIARADAMAKESAELQLVRDRLYNLSGISELDFQIDWLKKRPDQLRAQLRDDVLIYVTETGDDHPHDLIDYRRTSKPMYDDKSALEWSEEHAPEFVKVKRSLDKRKFNTAVKDGVVDFPGAEMVNVPTVAIKAVAHLLDG